MKNSKIYPFTRNRYFYGKLLTVRDFEIEQKYFNDKRRMTNSLAIGTGILSGLDVVAVNDRTISIDPGIAIDSLGREIVLSVPAMHMLSDIDGFDKDKMNDIYYLCLSYDEKPTELVHSVSQANEEGEYSRFDESYKLELRTEYKSSVERLKEKLIQTKYELYDSDEIKIQLIVQDIVSIHAPFSAFLIVHKKSEGIEMDVKLSLIGTYLNNGKPIEFHYFADASQTYGTATICENIDTDMLKPVVDTLKLHSGSFKVVIGEREIERAIDLQHTLEIISEDLQAAIRKKYYELPFDELMQDAEDDTICLGKINMIPAGDTYLIDSIEKPLYEDYILPNALASILKDYASETSQEAQSQSGSGISMQNVREEMDKVIQTYRTDRIRTGVYTFSPPENRMTEPALFSDEIPHGLGHGEAFLSFAIEHSPDMGDEFGSARQVFFGDVSAFEDSVYVTDYPNIQVSGVLYPNKGSFRMALSGELKSISRPVRIRWRVEKMSHDTDQPLSDDNPLRIEISPNPARVLPRQSVLLEAKDIDGDPVGCKWTVADEDGSIDENGLYTAPVKEGVYTVKAESDKGFIATGYIVVENE